MLNDAVEVFSHLEQQNIPHSRMKYGILSCTPQAGVAIMPPFRVLTLMPTASPGTIELELNSNPTKLYLET